MASATSDALPSAAPGMLRRLGIPWSDFRFWIIQFLVLGIDIGHLVLEQVQLLVGESELYLLSISAFLVPVVYAGLSFGVKGALPTAFWALILSLPEISLHGWTTRAGILIQFAIVIAIGMVVAIRSDRERSAARALEQANQRLSRLNATASAVANSLDLNRVLRGTLRADLSSSRDQVGWIRILNGPDMSAVTVIEVSDGDPHAVLDRVQEDLTTAACRTGRDQFDDPTGTDVHTLVTALISEGRTVGALGISQGPQAIPLAEFPVYGSIASQLGVALDNIRNHASTREALSELSKAKESLEIYIELATEAQEEERRRLSRELHDDTLQSLVVAKAKINATGILGLPAKANERLSEVEQILDVTVDSVRRYCRDLRPSLLDDLGLVDAIDWLVASVASRTATEMVVDVTGQPRRVGEHHELLIFRVVQEALRNVERHAGASHAWVGLDYGDETLSVFVTDDGRGLGTGRRSGRGHPAIGLGLRGMDERAKLLKGSLIIESRPAGGTKVLLLVPLAP